MTFKGNKKLYLKIDVNLFNFFTSKLYVDLDYPTWMCKCTNEHAQIRITENALFFLFSSAPRQ